MTTTDKLKWTRDGDQRVAQGDRFEYRITEWCVADGSTWSLAVKSLDTERVSDGGAYPSLQRAKEVAYSLDIR